MTRKTIAVLGATGSIGDSTLDLIRHNRDMFDVQVLSAHKNWQKLVALTQEFNPELIVINDENDALRIKDALGNQHVEIICGPQGLCDAARVKVDMMVTGIVGFAGLEPLLCAIDAGSNIAFANKECLVCAGEMVMQRVREKGVAFLPTDSEHNAIFQVFEQDNKDMIERLVLTASGGPFLNRRHADLKNITPEQAVKHPKWSMGAKISVDSATMMNKGLELIEAHYLFDMPAEKIKAVIHPQSLIHSFVEYKDGSFLAQMGAPDMRTPIAYALSWPKRMETTGARLDLLAGQLNFELRAIEVGQFPLYDLAQRALHSGQAAQIALNAANEVAVDCFLKKMIGFLDIVTIVDRIMQDFDDEKMISFQEILAFDHKIRNKSHALIQALI